MSMPPQDLGRREIRLLQLYCGCQFGMTPQEFYARWGVTQVQIAQICGVSEASVARWFTQGTTRRLAEAKHCRKLAEMHFLWEEYERIPLRLRRRLCPARTAKSYHRDRNHFPCGAGQFYGEVTLNSTQ